MQTILGAGGAIATELARALTAYTTDIRLVSRHPSKVNEGDQLFPADLTDPAKVSEAVRGSEIVYLTVGFPYKLKVWQDNWPLVMANVIAACTEHGAKLVFFDNIYMYDGRDLSHMTEQQPKDPPSQKGKVRAQVERMVWDAVRDQGLKALVARAADFYGPSVVNVSILTEMVFKPLSTGGTANWLMDDGYKHSFTYTPDAGKATALLGNTPDAYGEAWHLPTAPDPLTGKEWVNAVAKVLGAKPKYRIVGRFMSWLIGLFVPTLHENMEMLYQYDRDYVFNSDKFERRFGIRPTPYAQGLEAIARIDYGK